MVAGRIDDALEKGLDSVAAALGRNRTTRIAYQYPAGGVSGSRWLVTTASRSRPNSPRESQSSRARSPNERLREQMDVGRSRANHRYGFGVALDHDFGAGAYACE